MSDIRDTLGWSYLTKYLLLAIQFVSTVVIARLITPDDIGIYTVAAVFIGLGQLIREFGINRYIVHEPALTEERIRAASTLNLALGWGVGIVVFLAALPIGSFYGRGEVSEVLQLLSINFVFVPLGAIVFAYLRREMLFRKIMWVRVGSALVGTITGIVTAWYGEGYRALVWSAIAGTASTVVLCHLHRPRGLSLRPGLRQIGHVLRFCRYAGPETLIDHAGDTAPDWIIGKALDMPSVGIFSRASGTVALFSAIVLDGLASVLLPYFSRQMREGSESRSAYRHAVGCIVGLAWPFFIVLALLAAPIIELLYGAQWRAAAPLLQLLCLAAIPMVLTAIASDALTGIGQIKAVLRITLIMAATRIIVILLAAPYGLTAIAVALLLPSVIKLVLTDRAIRQHLDTGLSDMAATLWRNAALAIVTATPAALAVYLFGWTLDYSIMALMVTILASKLCWAGALLVLRPPLYREVGPLIKRLSALTRR